MDYVEINGEQIPFRRSLNAMTKFDAEFKGEGVSTFTPEKYEPRHLVYLWYCFIEAGCKFLNKPMPYSVEQLGDLITSDDLQKMAAEATEKNESEKKS